MIVTGGLFCPEVGGQPVATVEDYEPGNNVQPFPGDCLTTHEKCSPEISGPWTPGESSVLLLSFVPTICQDAVVKCTKGCGEISISNPGQSTFAVSPPPPEDDETGILGTLGAAAGIVGNGVSQGGRWLVGEAAETLPRVAPRIGARVAGAAAGGVAGAIAVELIFPDSTSDDDVIVHAKKSKDSGKAKANDIPGWQREYLGGESADDPPAEVADRVMRERHPNGDYPKGPGSEYQRLKKYLSRGARNK